MWCLVSALVLLLTKGVCYRHTYSPAHDLSNGHRRMYIYIYIYRGRTNTKSKGRRGDRSWATAHSFFSRSPIRIFQIVYRDRQTDRQQLSYAHIADTITLAFYEINNASSTRIRSRPFVPINSPVLNQQQGKRERAHMFSILASTFPLLRITIALTCLGTTWTPNPVVPPRPPASHRKTPLGVQRAASR